VQESTQSFFTLASFGTFAGASTIVMVLSNTVRKLLKIDSPWPAFIASLLAASVGAYSAGAWKTPTAILLIVLNACLLFCSALGIQQTAIGLTTNPATGGVTKRRGRAPVRWLSPWF